MLNKKIADIFYKLAIFLSMEKTAFRPFAHERAALALETLNEDVAEVYKKAGLAALGRIPGIGYGLSRKIEEYIKTGHIREYEAYKKRWPVALDELMAVEGIGPQKIKILYQKLGIRNVKDLEKAAKSRKIAGLAGFGSTSEQNILEAIAFLKRSQGRFLLAEILPYARAMIEELKALKEVKEISLAGSLRRMKETIGDVDVLAAAANPEKVMNFFIKLPEVVKVWGQGRTKSSIRTEQGFDIDLRIVPAKSYGAAQQYFTGSKEHNIVLRQIAINKGLKLNEYGLFKKEKMLASHSEQAIYKALGLAYIEPELRENRGEIEAAQRNALPRLVGLKDIKGDLHCHSDWSAGENTILEMAETAMARGYQYIGISDHTKFLKIENGLDEKQLAEQRKEIDKINKKFKTSGFNFQILQGAEVNILKDGRLDIKEQALAKLDYVIAGVHSSLKMSKEEMTERIIKAMKSPYVKIISHPTGRILKKRDAYEVDIDKLLRLAKETKTIMEINGSPTRLDLNDINIKRAKEAGVKMIINTDSHQREQLGFMELGIAQARRGWAERKDIVNTLPLADLLKVFQCSGKKESNELT